MVIALYINVLKTSVKQAVKDSTGILDSKLTPASVEESKEINKFVSSFAKKKTSKKVPLRTFNEFEYNLKKLKWLYKCDREKIKQIKPLLYL